MNMYHFIRYMYGRWLADVRGRNRDSSTIMYNCNILISKAGSDIRYYLVPVILNSTCRK